MQGGRAPLVGRGQWLAFAVVAGLFFSWALANSLNDVLVRHFRKALDLSRAEAGLVQSAFYFGYFVAALPAAALMRRHGYKAGILTGLGLYAAGALLFWPAAEARLFPAFLGALLVIALGLACLETAANPYVTLLGPGETASARLNLAQAFNGVGAVTGPLLGGLFILSGRELHAGAALDPAQRTTLQVIEAQAVQLPYLGLAAFVALLAVAVAATRLPDVVESADDRVGARAALALRQVREAVAAQFFYVAAQVCIWSYFIDFTKEMMPSAGEQRIAFLLSSSIALLMLGRFGGAWVLRRMPAARALGIAAAANLVLCAVAATGSGVVPVAAIWLTSLFMSIMFPTIFALGIAGLGPATKAASSMLIMSIVGGAILPPLMGLLADRAGGLQAGMVVPLVCFAVVARFAWRSTVPTRKGLPHATT